MCAYGLPSFLWPAFVRLRFVSHRVVHVVADRENIVPAAAPAAAAAPAPAAAAGLEAGEERASEEQRPRLGELRGVAEQV